AIDNAREFARTAAERPEAVPVVELPGDSVFGSSPAIREVLAIVRRIAPSRCSVLLTGERGTGREMVARGIHAQGPHRDAPFFKVACSGGASGELETVLRGEIAPGATVYLENVHELSLEQQHRLGEQIRRGAPAEGGDGSDSITL